MIYIIDYGAGNLKSAVHAISSYAKKSKLISTLDEITETPNGLVLPGDGSFPYAYNNLKKSGFADYIKSHSEIPLLGICVGFQLLFSFSEEEGGSEGLDLIKGRIKRFPNNVGKVPHMGWNKCEIKKDHAIFSGVNNNEWFYFVHSYYAQVNEDTSMTCDYRENFCSAVIKDNIYGFQFHPEKSSTTGLKIVENFVKICEKD